MAMVLPGNSRKSTAAVTRASKFIQTLVAINCLFTAVDTVYFKSDTDKIEVKVSFAKYRVSLECLLARSLH